jgi:hypothetical protein
MYPVHEAANSKRRKKLREAKKSAKRRRLQSLIGESSEGKISRVLRGEIDPKGLGSKNR